MIWQYFPVGFRFPVKDFSVETRRSCWETTLSALFAADPIGLTLYDAQQTYDIGTGGPVYICIACYYGIKQARANAKAIYGMDELMVQLSRSMPFIQANALESFGPYRLLGKIEDNGTLSVTEDGEAVLKDVQPKPISMHNGMRLLIVSDESETVGSAETCTRVIGKEAAEHGFSVQRVSIADGGYGTVRTLIGGASGRYEAVSFTDAAGMHRTEAIGILPGKIAALDAAGRDAKTIFDLIHKSLDLGYRRILLGAIGCLDADIAEISFEPIDSRLSECECRMLNDGSHNAFIDALALNGFRTVPGAETVMDMIGFDSLIGQSDFAILHTYGKSSCAVSAALGAFNAHRKPTYFICRDPLDINLLMHTYPVLRGASAINGISDESAVLRTFLGEVLPMLGKDVAKATRI